jgi:mersacidin/lichenicidin family type 2 lantibiotic
VPACNKEIPMKKVDLARAWRDEDYYLSLSAAERAALPANPAAAMSVSDADLKLTGAANATSALNSCTGTAICSPCGRYNCD